MTYATPTDVAAELRGSTNVTDAEQIQWQRWLDRVERAIDARFARIGLNLATQVSVGNPTGDVVADVEVAAVVRRINSPTMAVGASRTVTVDDGSVTTRNDLRPSDGYDPLALTDSELELLLPASQPEAFSTRPGFAPDCRRGAW